MGLGRENEWRMVYLHSRNGVGALSRGSGLVQRVCNYVCMNYGDRNVYDMGYVTHNTGEGGITATALLTGFFIRCSAIIEQWRCEAL